jgi:glutamate-1-semialdehyde 2,1-aminomutase
MRWPFTITVSDGWWLIPIACVLCAAIVIAARKAIAAVLTLPALAILPVALRRLAPWVAARHYAGDDFLSADGAPATLVARRRQAIDRLADELGEQYAQSAGIGRSLRERVSDLRFADASRVPFPFAREMSARFSLYSVVTESRGPRLRHVDGHWTIDVSGSYGLNVAGFDRYKRWIEGGWERVKALGPVLGPLHPVVAEDIAILTRVSGLDEVSFHMSGTEAVMAAVRLARFNTRRKRIVCFAGAYHGWWDGVQPGLGSERAIDDCLTLKDMHPASLAVIRRRASEIAAVLVNPVQAFHPNSPPPNDAILLTSEARKAEDSVERYREWLHELRETCKASGVPLILDEIYTGFRLAPGGAQEFFGIDADLIVYGKTIAGGMPIGVVCGRSWLMRRVDPDRPLRMAYVVGTFSAHPLVMGAMREFLAWIEGPEAASEYAAANARCAEWTRRTNRRLAEALLPMRVVCLGTIWTVLFKDQSRYNWLLQYYLRAQGITLSWVGTGRCLASLDFSSADFAALTAKLVAAAEAMRRDGWWPAAGDFPERESVMKKRLAREVIAGVLPRPLQGFYTAVMQRKDDDHHASHNNAMNQYLHLLSSSVFIYCYAIIGMNLTQAMFLGLGALLIRQLGHAVFEPSCHDEEALLLGFNTPKKTLIVIAYIAIPIVLLIKSGLWSVSGFISLSDAIALQWFRLTVAVVLGRVVYLTWKHDFRIAMIWFVKLVTDPFTDVVAYFPRRAQHA